MLTLTVNIGGVFDSKRMIRRERGASGPCPLREIEQLVPLGGPVTFAGLRVALLTGTASPPEVLEAARC